jgi:oxygen-independent coproporphyrinogen III oxidase
MNPPQLSLYIHVPFCKKKCRYCDFYSLPQDESATDAFVEALLVEWDLMRRQYRLHDIPIATLFFGGGTPSMLSLKAWKKISDKLVSSLYFTENYEWSIECNPDSFTEEKALFWLDCGVTRLSIGVQSLVDRELRILGRIHDSQKALEVLGNAVLARFASIGVDIMYGLPGQTASSLKSTIETVFSYPHIRHISAYELTLGETTAFGRHQKRLPLPSEDVQISMTETVVEMLRDRGFERYEISNFSLPGHACRHNQTYWQHTPYIGLGPSAHSYLPPQRFSNSNSIDDYINKLNNRILPTGFTETLDRKALSREMIFLGLRTSRGISETDYRKSIGSDFASPQRAEAIAGFIRTGMMDHVFPFYRLTSKGMLFADAIARELMM